MSCSEPVKSEEKGRPVLFVGGYSSEMKSSPSLQCNNQKCVVCYSGSFSNSYKVICEQFNME